MRIPQFPALICLVFFGATVHAASSWGFSDGIVAIHAKGAGVDAGLKEKIRPSEPLRKPLILGASDTLKVSLTTVLDREIKRPHQAFLLIEDSETNLDTSYALSVKENGKAKVELTQRDLPAEFLITSRPLRASLVIASFGDAKGYRNHVFDFEVRLDPDHPIPIPEKPLRYGKLDEIHHTFRPDPKSPPKIVTFFFTAAVLATLPILVGAWVSLGANLNHLPQALRNAPIPHVLFFGSIVTLEGIFFLYYTRWNLFQTLPAVAVVGPIAFLSGSRALSEVQERRLAGQR